MKNLSILFLTFAALFFAAAKPLSDCSTGLLFKEGAFFEMKSFDAKDKLQSTAKHTVKTVKTENGRQVAEIHTAMTDQKGKPVNEFTYSVSCANGVFHVDMKNMFDPAMMQNYDGMQVSVDGTELEVPSTGTAGQKLNDGKVTLVIEGPLKMTNTITVTNRKVEGYESITTPAGTFNCMKISYDVATKMVVNITGRAEEWYAPEVGTVQTKSYDGKGKLTGYTQLTAISK